MFMDSVPDSAACNEAVKIAARHKFVNLKGFVNGVLRNISRNKDNIEYPDRNIEGGCRYLSVYYSCPEWICRLWTERFGFDKTKAMLEFFLQARPTTVRLKVSDGEGDERSYYKNEFEKAGAQVRENEVLSYALDLEKTDNIRFLPGFEEGAFTVQDVSSMLLTEIADPGEGQTVIDVCAAPGGKSMHAAERVGNEGKVLSMDISDHKCDIISENAQRMGLSNIEVRVHDARIHDEALEESADILYLDVPCSGLGIMGRKNDIKYNVTPESIDALSSLQWEIVRSSFNYVKKGGILMYSTCTVSEKENEETVRRICKELPFEIEDIRKTVPKDLLEKLGSQINEEGMLQIIPGSMGTDGFFIARLRRKDN